MNRPLRLLADIESARKVVAKFHAEGFPGKPAYRATPACDRRCPKCDIACAILTGELHDLEQEAATLFQSPPGPGSIYIMEPGRA